jgi:predicted HTH transcriptional regulator
MTLRELKSLVARGESNSLEFKRKVMHPEKIVREIVAFANTNGGKLLIGIGDEGSIPGVKFPNDEIYSLNTTIEKLCKPQPHFEIESIAISSKSTVLLYHIRVSDQRPLYVKDDTEDNYGKVYVRHKDKSIQASREVREIIKRKKKNKDIKFNYGEKEKILMKYFEAHKTITLNEFRAIANLNRYVASNTLIILVLANVLLIEPNDKGDLYMLKNKY